MALSDILSSITGIANTAYNLYTNKRDFDYQKSLQNKIFEREDTAVQRRMNDLENSGLNPNLAAGSSAGAGSVVSRSNTNDVNFGSALDMIQAVNNIRQQRQQTENAKVENQILNYQKDLSQINFNKTLAETMYGLGIPVEIQTNKKGDKFNFKTVLGDNEDGQFIWKNAKPFFDQIDYQTNSMKNSAALLEKDVDFYTSDKIASYLVPLLRLLK